MKLNQNAEFINNKHVCLTVSKKDGTSTSLPTQKYAVIQTAIKKATPPIIRRICFISDFFKACSFLQSEIREIIKPVVRGYGDIAIHLHNVL